MGITSAVFADRFLGWPLPGFEQQPEFIQSSAGGARPLGRLLRRFRFACNASGLELAHAIGNRSRRGIDGLERGVIASPSLFSVARVTGALARSDLEHRDLLTWAVAVFAGEAPDPGRAPERPSLSTQAATLRLWPGDREDLPGQRAGARS